MRRWNDGVMAEKNAPQTYVFPTCSSTLQLTQHPPHPPDFLSLPIGTCHSLLWNMSATDWFWAFFSAKAVRLTNQAKPEKFMYRIVNSNSLLWALCWIITVGGGNHHRNAVWGIRVTSVVSNHWLDFCGLECRPHPSPNTNVVGVSHPDNRIQMYRFNITGTMAVFPD